MVQRYDYDTKIVDGWEENHDIFENDDGGYVKHEDYLALAAQVEVLQSWLRQVAELINLDGGTAIDWLIDTHQEMLSAAKSTPAACLAQVRAEAGRAGFVAGAEWWAKCELEDTLHLDEQSAANQYAESIRQGEVK